MKLQQGQVWKLDAQFLRIVLLERLFVEYKAGPNLATREGTRQRVTKKEFCRLIKTATLVPPGEIPVLPRHPADR
jgi:hypothetical protein